MKSEGLSKILLIGFAGALALYIVSFSFIQNRRVSKGPWEVTFQTDAAAKPNLLVQNRKLNIRQKIIFSETSGAPTNLTDPVVFDDPTKTNVPFGSVVFQDLTFLPGTVTLDLFGHEVELLPRVLIIDKKEYSWQSGEEILVPDSDAATKK